MADRDSYADVNSGEVAILGGEKTEVLFYNIIKFKVKYIAARTLCPKLYACPYKTPNLKRGITFIK